jgi:hypothetical protein
LPHFSSDQKQEAQNIQNKSLKFRIGSTAILGRPPFNFFFKHDVLENEIELNRVAGVIGIFLQKLPIVFLYELKRQKGSTGHFQVLIACPHTPDE